MRFSRNFTEKCKTIVILCRNLKKSRPFLPTFCWNFEIWAVQRIAYLLDLAKCWKMSIWSQKSALIQRRTSPQKKFDKNLRRFWVSSGAKVWESCRSRKTLQNEYLDAKIGVDTAENEPSKVWWFGWKIRVRFDIESFNEGRHSQARGRRRRAGRDRGPPRSGEAGSSGPPTLALTQLYSTI